MIKKRGEYSIALEDAINKCWETLQTSEKYIKRNQKGRRMEIVEIKNGIEDWFAIIDYDDKEQSSWCRRNITALRKQIKKIKKERGNN